MISIFFIIALFLAAVFFSNFIKKNEYYLYVVGVILSILVIIFKDFPITKPFNNGFLGFSFFYIVMINGVFKHESNIYKKLYSVRSTYSILGFIVLTPHAIFYLIDRLNVQDKVGLIIGIIAYIIMIPLFITSFKKIENKKQLFQWKKLQRFAYLAYLLIFVHLLVITFNASYIPNLILYLVLFVPYFFYKPYHFFKYEKPYYKSIRQKDETHQF